MSTTAFPPEAASKLAPYRPLPGFYDEVLHRSGRPRRHWRKLAVALRHMGLEEFTRRWQEARQVIHDNGVTYNVYGDPRGTDRPWPLDPIPLTLDPIEWTRIEAAIRQRATLLNELLKDFYGPQTLLKQKTFPPFLVHGNPGFLRPCHGIKAPGGIYLHVYAADLARSPDGQWWVLSDRTQAPSGAGYALENRVVSSRTLPDVFGDLHVRRLARFFQHYRETLQRLAPHNHDNPRIVLLTPGPYNETYFEQSYLARYLGYTLVEGGDLTVSGERVYLKTLGGLLPVDVILRRQDDSFTDPLELRGESLLGIPGLVQAARAGNVTVANALGSGLVETAAHMAFLPGLCRTILGEDLKMPSVATWWCGQPQPMNFVLDNLDRLVIKPTFPGPGAHPLFPESMERAAREKLKDQIREAPGQYVAQEQVALSTAPVFTDDGLRPRHIVLRVYAVAHNGGYSVMPGGLTRFSIVPDSLVVSMQRGGGSKDTWVLSEQPEPPFTLIRPARPVLDINRSTFDLPSRIADNLFWLGRYTERVEAAVRLARTLLPGLADEGELGDLGPGNAGARLLVGFGYLKPSVLEAGEESQRKYLERVLLALVFDRKRPAGLGWNVNQVRRVAWLLKERLSGDTWRVLKALESDFSTAPPNQALRYSTAIHLLDRSIVTLSAFSGLVMESMTRGQGWRFLDLGRRLERAQQMIGLLLHGLVPITNNGEAALEMLLRIADSSITYRSRYLTSLQTDLVLDLLLADEANPRSVAFQLKTLLEHMERLPPMPSETRHPLETRMALKALTAVRLGAIEELARTGQDGERLQLRMLLDDLRRDLAQLAEALTQKYLTHTVAAHLLSTPTA